MTELMNVLGKSYEKLKKILIKTYDHNLPVLKKLTTNLRKPYETVMKS